MASGKCAYNEIVAEPLTIENQEAWFVCVKNFLLARDLWEVVEGTKNPYENSVSWRRKNAEALHIMQISCTPESRSHIMKVSNAKAAWDILSNMYNNNEDSSESPMPPQEAGDVDFNVTKFYKAICEDNWRDAKTFLELRRGALKAKLTHSKQTALHVAAHFGHVGIVEELLKSVSEADLEIVDVDGKTPLLTATYSGITPVAKLMVIKNRRILGISTPDGHLPVSLAFCFGHKEMAHYLYDETPLEYLKRDNGLRGLKLLYNCFKSGDLDVAHHLLQKCQELLFASNGDEWNPIRGLATMPSAFPSGSQLIFWQRWIYKCIHIQSTTITNDVHVDIPQQDQSNRIHAGLPLRQRLIPCIYNLLGMKEIYQLKSLHADADQILKLFCEKISVSPTSPHVVNIVKDALFDAAREGIVEFVDEVVKANPDLILFRQKGSGWHTFFFAVRYRQAAVFNLIRGLRFKDALTTVIDSSGNSLLHVVGMFSLSSQLNRSFGAALQMHNEVQWFEAVKREVPLALKLSRNNDGKLPEDIFKESHEELLKEGEEWIKRTASSNSIVGVLIVTIMFAAAFTVPGGNNQESGYPIFLGKRQRIFLSFITVDVISLCFSTFSVLVFIGILSSPNLGENFLQSSHTWLIRGLFSLFISILYTMIAFAATIFIMLDHGQSETLFFIIVYASVPVIFLFGILGFPPFVQLIKV